MTEMRPRDAQRTRQLLLDAGERLFAERGVDGTSTDEIARASGVNKAMINYHFGGKDGLYAAIVVDLLEGALAELEALPKLDLSGEAKLREFIRIFARKHGQRSSVSAMILREVMSGGRRMEEPFRQRFLRVFRVLSEILGQGAREGSFRPVAALEAHLAMMGALTFFFATRPFRERMQSEGKIPFSPCPPDDYVAFLEELVIRGLAPPSPASKIGRRAQRVAMPKKSQSKVTSRPRRSSR